MGYTFERTSNMKVPVFDTKDVLELLTKESLLGYLAEMLSSFTRIESYAISFRARQGTWKKIRFNDLDIHSLMSFCEVVENEHVVFKSSDMFPAQRGKAYYQSQGFREVGMFLGATRASYRKTCERLNRQRRQEVGGTPLNTLRDATEAEGVRILDFWAVKTDSVLEAAGVDASHPPTPELCGSPKRIVKESQAVRAEVRKALVEAEIPEELQDEVKTNPVCVGLR